MFKHFGSQNFSTQKMEKYETASVFFQFKSTSSISIAQMTQAFHLGGDLRLYQATTHLQL